MATQSHYICFPPGDASFAMITFPADPAQEPPRKRARLSPVSRANAAVVRKRGGCLRCRLLKIKCSGNDPCDTCLKLARTHIHKLEGKTLRFSECIRTRIRDVNIFESMLNYREGELTFYSVVPPRIPLMLFYSPQDCLGKVIARLGPFPRSITFRSKEIGYLHHFVINRWLAGSLSPGLVKDYDFLQQFPTTRESASAACRVLHYLDLLQANGNNSRHPFPIEVAKANAILVAGTILRVYYTPNIEDSQNLQVLDLETGTNRKSTLWSAMKEHLILMLTHYFVFLITRLDDNVTVELEHNLLRGSVEAWFKEHNMVIIDNSNIVTWMGPNLQGTKERIY